eukprot:PITA_20039
MTLKAFDGQTYTMYGILSNLQVELEGKIVEIDVEVIDGNLDYNILLGRPWIYAMVAVVSTYFRNISFPFQGGITIIDQQTFLPNSSQVTGSISMIRGSSHSLQNIRVGLLKDPTLMETITINISTKPDVVKNIHVDKSCSSSELEIYCALFCKFRDVFAWSYEEMPGIDSSIVEHEIKIYPDVKLVSNIITVMKKQGTIRVCVDYRDLNQACPKDNYPTPFIDQIIDECARCEIFSFMDGFSGYNQINIHPQDQSKISFICSWGTFTYCKLPFGLKNAGVTFQRAMNYAFHDIKNIFQPYLDDLPTHSRKRIDHPQHLRAIFLRCQHYKIRLNPHKCVFCVGSGHLLGFLVSKDGIRLDPCKVQATINMPPPSNLL